LDKKILEECALCDQQQLISFCWWSGSRCGHRNFERIVYQCGRQQFNKFRSISCLGGGCLRMLLVL